MANFKPSKYQQEIFDWVKEGTGSAIVEAVAGSGKTTTIVQALNHIDATKKCIFLAFNKSIADELKLRVPKNVYAATFHSVGFRAWTRENRNCQVDDRKVRKIAKDLLEWEEYTAYGKFIVDLVSLAKQRGIGCLVPDEMNEWQEIISHFDIQLETSYKGDMYQDEEERAISCARKVLMLSSQQAKHVVDFDDMIYMPIKAKLNLEQYDWVLIDEAQDTNGTRRALATKMLKPDSRLIAVGDTHQAIYGFTGADSDSIQLIREAYTCSTFPLSISYRCAKNIVLEAKRIVPDIEPSETAPEGIVAAGDFKGIPPQQTDAILCRNTAPLVSLAYYLLAQGIGCKVLGSDIGQSLSRLIEKMKANNIDELEEQLTKYLEAETRRYLKRDEEHKIQGVVDKVECIRVIIDNLPFADRTLEKLDLQIATLFGDNVKNLLTLSTMHKAKGLEWDRVFIYMPELLPSRYARQPWQLQQEMNLSYVAITRAKKELYYVPQVIESLKLR